MAKLVLLTTLLILVPLTTSTPTKTKDNGGCPATWVKFGHSCYKLIKDKYRWFDAQAVCKRLHSTLVNIGSTQEDKFVKELSNNKSVSTWIGLSDVVEEGSFVWIDTQEEAKYTNWFKGEPDNYKGKEDCVNLEYEHKGKWNDADCENNFSAVCEKPSDDDDEDKEECPDKWLVFGHSCYKLLKENNTWNDSQAVCKTLNSYLVNIGSEEEDLFVVTLARNYEVHAWIGLNDIAQEGTFEWADTHELPKYTHWVTGAPNNAEGKEDCVLLWYEMGGRWNDDSCKKRFSAVCEKPFDMPKDIPRCPDKWLVFGHSCYKLLKENNTWNDSQAVCKTLNSYLVNIGSEEEDLFVVTLAHNYEVHAWIGLNDIAQEGTFEWADTHELPKYTHWVTGAPNNAEGKEDCVLLWYEMGGRWNDDSCKKRFSAVCEKPFDMPKDIPRCPDKWLVFGHSCYKLLKENNTWNDSQAVCKTLNSYLVNIGSEEEDLFVVTLARNYEVHAWIGLNDIAQEGTFEWADTHELPKYTHWVTGAPNNAEGKEDCVLLWYEMGGRWNDDSCKKRFSAVCEKPFDMIDE